eukprot:5154080-Pyramimonas_sp.AAC.1
MPLVMGLASHLDVHRPRPRGALLRELLDQVPPDVVGHKLILLVSDLALVPAIPWPPRLHGEQHCGNNQLVSKAN